MSSHDEMGDGPSVDTAYARLEAIIRNFSREKMSLEEAINSLNRDLELKDKDMVDNNEILKSVTVERDRLKQSHEEDEKARFTVETMVISCEKNIQILIDTLNSYDLALQDIMSSSESRDEFNQIVKKIQLELHNGLQEEGRRFIEASQKHKEGDEQKGKEIQTLKERINELVHEVKIQNDEVKGLRVIKDDLTQQLDSLTKEVTIKSEIIDQLRNEKRSCEVETERIRVESEKKLMELESAEERIARLLQDGEVKDEEIKGLQVIKNDLSRQLDSLTNEITVKSEIIDQLGSEKRSCEEVSEQFRVESEKRATDLQFAEERIAHLLQDGELKEKEIKELQVIKDDLTQQLDSLSKEIVAKSDSIVQLGTERQQIEGQLLIQLRVTKEKDDEIQEIGKQNSKQLQIIRSGYEDLSSMLEITKNEKASLTESHSNLLSAKKQMEHELNEELVKVKENAAVLQGEVETLKVVQKRYLDLKKHLSSLMKEKTSNRELNNSRSSSKNTENSQEKNTNSLSNTPSQDEKSKKSDDTTRPTFRRSQPPVITARSPKSILRSQSETLDKKNVSFCSPLSFCVGLTSSSDSSPDTDLDKNSQKEQPPSTPQKRSRGANKKDDDLNTPEKKSKTNDSEVAGRKFFRKKPVLSTPAIYRTQK